MPTPLQQALLDINAADPNLLASMPKVFIDQANQGFNYATINADMLKNQLLRLQIVDAKVSEVEEGGQTIQVPTFKIRPTGILDKTTRGLVAMTKGLTKLPDHQTWITSFNTLAFTFTPEVHVAHGIVSAQELKQLLAYADQWERGIEDSGDINYWYGPGKTQTRLYFTAKSADSYLEFLPVIRTNPTLKTLAIGIDDLCFNNLSLLGAGIGGNPGTMRLANSNETVRVTATPVHATAPAPVVVPKPAVAAHEFSSDFNF